MSNPSEVLRFWKSIGPKGWWMKDDAVDQNIIDQFGALHTDAVAGNLSSWKNDPDHCLACVIILDQFSRNMFRGDAKTFASDGQALELAREAVAKGFDQRCEPEVKPFYYLPYMHSESLSDQNDCMKFMHAHGGAQYLKAAIQHREIIQRFGRYPHRNKILGRHTTPAEQAYLDADGFKG